MQQNPVVHLVKSKQPTKYYVYRLSTCLRTTKLKLQCRLVKHPQHKTGSSTRGFASFSLRTVVVAPLKHECGTHFEHVSAFREAEPSLSQGLLVPRRTEHADEVVHGRLEEDHPHADRVVGPIVFSYANLQHEGHVSAKPVPLFRVPKLLTLSLVLLLPMSCLAGAAAVHRALAAVTYFEWVFFLLSAVTLPTLLHRIPEQFSVVPVADVTERELHGNWLGSAKNLLGGHLGKVSVYCLLTD